MSAKRFVALFSALLSAMVACSLGLAFAVVSVEQPRQSNSSVATGTVGPASGGFTSSSGAQLLENKKKKKQKKKQKERQRKQRQQRQAKKNERRADREQQSNSPRSSSPQQHQQPTRVGAQRPNASQTTTRRNQTETKWNGNSVTVKHDARGVTKSSVDGPNRSAPPRQSQLNRTPVKIAVKGFDDEVKKFGTDQAHVRVLGADLNASAEFGGGQISARGSAAISLVSGHAEKTFATPMGNVKTKADASVGADIAGTMRIGKDGVNVGVEAFVGVKASGSVSYGVEGIEAVATAEVQAGLSFAADAGAQWVDGTISFNWKLGAAVGVGGKLAGNLVIDPAKAVDTVGDAVGDVGAAAAGTVEDLGEIASTAIDSMADAGTQLAGTVGKLFDW